MVDFIDMVYKKYKVLKRFDFTKFDHKIIVVEFLDLDAYKWEIRYNNINKLKRVIHVNATRIIKG